MSVGTLPISILLLTVGIIVAITQRSFLLFKFFAIFAFVLFSFDLVKYILNTLGMTSSIKSIIAVIISSILSIGAYNYVTKKMIS